MSTLDRIVIQGELQEFKKAMEELKRTLEQLSERLTKVEADAGVTEAGFHIIANALELNGFLVGGEPVKISDSKPRSPSQKEPAVTVKEETLACLSFEPQKGERLGDYETASAKNNIPDKFNAAFNVLSKSNATISNRYHGQGYVFSYWVYTERIFRQKPKPKTPKAQET